MKEVDATDAVKLVVDVLVSAREHVSQSAAHPCIEELRVVVRFEEGHCAEDIPMDLQLNETLQLRWKLARKVLRYLVILHRTELNRELYFSEEMMRDSMLALDL